MRGRNDVAEEGPATEAGSDSEASSVTAATRPNDALTRADTPDAARGEGSGEAIDLSEDREPSWNWGRRYQRRELLGVGGMGEVALYKDHWIGRDVALKTLRTTEPVSEALRKRFYREMRVQGQLEHPAIVPVYDFGLDPEGRLYFTMRRVRGPTLKQILKGLADGDAEMSARYSRRKLLTAFVSICFAVHYAHTRGVLHRDLKPSNLMLGEFGEVYVLDWGIAKLVGSSRSSEPALTHWQALLGTPAYMAPEQLLRRPSLDARADGYALGMILFELLAREAVHKGRGMLEIKDATLEGLDNRPSTRAADVPPELDLICVRATARDPAGRFNSVEALALSIERYLDGDRDLEQRRAAADLHGGRAAQAAAVAAKPESEPPTAEEARAEAMREVMKALAFDPTHVSALRTLVELMVKVPERMPAEVEIELQRATVGSRRESVKMALVAFVHWLGFIPLGLVMGVRSWASYAFAIGVVLAGIAYSWWVWRHTSVRAIHNYVLAILSAVALASASSVLGPFLLVPTGAAVMTLLFTTLSTRRERTVLTLIGVLAFLVPWALEAVHAVPPSLAFEGGRLLVLPRGYDLSPRVTLAVLLYGGVAWIILPPLILGRLRDALGRAEGQLFLHAWQLRRLLPAGPKV